MIPLQIQPSRRGHHVLSNENCIAHLQDTNLQSLTTAFLPQVPKESTNANLCNVSKVGYQDKKWDIKTGVKLEALRNGAPWKATSQTT